MSKILIKDMIINTFPTYNIPVYYELKRIYKINSNKIYYKYIHILSLNDFKIILN